jgi:hypothetical protein
MLGHRRRLDKIVRKQLYPAATTRGGLRHRRRADGLCVLDLRGADSHLQSGLWRRGDSLSPGRHGGLLDDFFHRLGGSFRSLRDLWCRLLHRHPCRDVTTFSFSTCQREDKCVSDYDYSSRSSIASEEYSPSTTLASGSGVSVAGGSGTAWEVGGLLGGRRDLFRHR